MDGYNVGYVITWINTYVGFWIYAVTKNGFLPGVGYLQ